MVGRLQHQLCRWSVSSSAAEWLNYRRRHSWARCRAAVVFPLPFRYLRASAGLLDASSEQQKELLSGLGTLLACLACTAVGFRFLFYGYKGDGKRC